VRGVTLLQWDERASCTLHTNRLLQVLRCPARMLPYAAHLNSMLGVYVLSPGSWIGVRVVGVLLPHTHTATPPARKWRGLWIEGWHPGLMSCICLPTCVPNQTAAAPGLQVTHQLITDPTDLPPTCHRRFNFRRQRIAAALRKTPARAHLPTCGWSAVISASR